MVAVALAVGLPALMVALMALDSREVTGRGVLTVFLLTLIPAALGAAIALEYGRRRPDRLDWSPITGAAPAARQALRAGHTDDPRVDALARKEAQRRLGERWLIWIFGTVALSQVVGAIGGRPSRVLLAVLSVGLWSVYAWQRRRGLREARAYLARPAEGVAATPPVESVPGPEHPA
ncbi:hypothetical protein GA0074704_1919 [Micromonospora siamensis]|uniref:Uncharacterized protein n=2 Tax=Micromonospora siamensis TaxID=299152 RepID=A0A1C5HKS2_9ACTN|nr:hypothetical protein GA0074704_1919 [Micromonospora siamensis]